MGVALTAVEYAPEGGGTDAEVGWFTASDGIELAYRRWQPADGTLAQHHRDLVLILHGLGEHSGRYDGLAQRLVAAGYSVLAMDLRGHGRSPGRRGVIPHWDRYLDDLGAFLNGFSVDEGLGRQANIIWFCHSMGALLGLDALLHRGLRADAFIASAPAVGPLPAPPWLARLVPLAARVAPRLVLPWRLSVASLSRDTRAQRVCRSDALNHRRISPGLIQHMQQAKLRVWADATRLDCPLLILQGGADPIADPGATRRFADALPAGLVRLHEYPHGVHELVHDSDSELVMADLVLWLQEL